MPQFFRMYERFRNLRYLLALAAFALLLTILADPVMFLIIGLLVVIFSLFWPLIVNDCYITDNDHRPSDFLPRVKLYCLPIGGFGLYMLMTYLDLFHGIGLYTPDDINKYRMSLVMMWYSIAITVFTGFHLINCSERTYKYILERLR